MVVFTCNYCGDSLQKPKVEKHYNFVCRASKSLTCIDCLKDFRGEEYASHTKCLTEEERYAAKGAFANGIIKKGEVKQESWIEMIKSIIEKETNLKPSIRNLLNTISNYNNVPRKKPKFLNFIKSSSGGRANMKEVEEVWNIIEKYKADQGTSKGQNGTKSQENTSLESKLSKNDTEETNNDDDSKAMDGNGKKDIKKKKKKAKGEETIESANTEVVEEEISNTNNSVGPNLENSKKKKKQSKEEKVNVEEHTDMNGINGNLENGTKKKSKKKKLQDVETTDSSSPKKPKLNVTNEENAQDQEAETNLEGDTNGTEGNIDSGNKKKSKKKKLQDAETAQGSSPKKPKLNVTNEETVLGQVEATGQSQEKETNLEGHIDKNGTVENIDNGNKKKSKKKKLQDTETSENSSAKKPKLNATNEENIQSQEPENKNNKTYLEEHIDTNGIEENIVNGIKKKSKKKKSRDVETIENISPDKNKLDDTNEENVPVQGQLTDSFNIGQKILEILTSKGSISKNKLEKKVIAAYLKHYELSESSPKIVKKFNKKLKKLDNIEIQNDNILLKTN